MPERIQALDLTLPSMAANLALDEALLRTAEETGGPEVLRLWEWPTLAVVLGAGGKVEEDVDEPACAADAVPILRRGSGGGTVLLGRGCLLFSLILSLDRPGLAEIRSSYAHILSRMASGFLDVLPEVRAAGTSDLAVGGLKFSGNSQQRKRRFLLHHGTLLYDFDIATVSTYLRQPLRQPDYRGGRSHEAFLCNVPLTAADVKKHLSQVWAVSNNLNRWPTDLVESLIAEKYGNPAWIYRR